MSKQWNSARKVLALVLAIVMIAGFFVGCDSDDDTSETPTATATPTPTPSDATLTPSVEIEYDETQFEITNTTLVKYIGSGGDVIIPDKVTVIAPNAFANCTQVTAVKFPKTVREIGERAFSGCTGLSGVLTYKNDTLPNNLNHIGDYAFSGCTGITEVTLANKLYTMGTNVFDGCTSLAKAFFPDQFVLKDAVTYLPAETFRGCVALNEVEIFAKAVRIDDCAFEGCVALNQITIPDDVETMGKNVFKGCTALADITFAKSLIKIGSGSLKDTAWYTAALSKAGEATGDARYVLVGKNAIVAYAPEQATGDITLTIPDKATAICEGAFDAFMNRIVAVEFSASSRMVVFGDGIFSGAVKLTTFAVPSKVQELPADLFNGCTNLATIETNKCKLTLIGDRAFNQCVALEEIYLPDAITYIGDYAFFGCKALTSILFPANIETVGDYAFKNCTSIDEFTFRPKLSDVGVQAFDNTAWYINLSKYDVEPQTNQFHIFGDGVLIKADIKDSTIVIPDEVKSIAAFTFNGWSAIGEREFYGSSLPKSVTIPAGVTSIAPYAFYCCENLETVILSNTIVSIGENAFYGCKKLESIEVPASVTSISNYAFYGCTALADVTLPSTLRSIGKYAFYNCFALEDVTIPASATVGEYAFDGTPWYSANK